MDSRPIILKPIDMNLDENIALVDELLELSSSLDIVFSRESAELCVEHLLYVVQVNEYINLTRITDLHEALILHILDSLTLNRFIPQGVSKVLDMGTGAGFPGIPLAITNDVSIELLDSVGKKIKADNAFIKQLELDNVQGFHDRIESYANTQRGSFDLVVARALAGLPILIEYATPFLSTNGSLLVSKGNPSVEEFETGLKVAKICGLELRDNFEFDLPNNLGHRQILRFQRVSAPSVKLPRANGEARRNPLA